MRISALVSCLVLVFTSPAWAQVTDSSAAAESDAASATEGTEETSLVSGEAAPNASPDLAQDRDASDTPETHDVLQSDEAYVSQELTEDSANTLTEAEPTAGALVAGTASTNAPVDEGDRENAPLGETDDLSSSWMAVIQAGYETYIDNRNPSASLGIFYQFEGRHFSLGVDLNVGDVDNALISGLKTYDVLRVRARVPLSWSTVPKSRWIPRLQATVAPTLRMLDGSEADSVFALGVDIGASVHMNLTSLLILEAGLSLPFLIDLNGSAAGEQSRAFGINLAVGLAFLVGETNSIFTRFDLQSYDGYDGDSEKHNFAVVLGLRTNLSGSAAPSYDPMLSQSL